MSRNHVRFTLACAVALLVSACGNGIIEAPQGGGDDEVSHLTVAPLALTTAEDTPITATAQASGELGALHATLIQTPQHGTLALDATTVTYTPAADYAGHDSAIVTVRDDQKVATVTVDITVTPVNDPPRLTSTPSLSLDEDTFLALGTSNLAIADVDSDASSITVTINAGANYAVTVANQVHPAQDFNGALVVGLTLSDGTATADIEVTANVAAINDAPVNTVPAPLATTDDEAVILTGAATLLVADVDADMLDVAISVNDCTLTLAQITGLTFTDGDGTADATVHFSGTKSAINGALVGAAITPPVTFDGVCTVAITTSDLGATGNGGVLVATDSFVVGVNDVDLPPAITMPSDVSMLEDATFPFTGANRVSVVDSDTPTSTHLDVVLDVASGTLSMSVVTGITFAGGSTNGSTHLAFGGTFTTVNAALASLSYTPLESFNGVQTITLTATESGVAPVADACDVTVSPVNDAPTFTHGPSTIAVFQNTDVPFTTANAVSVGDLDGSIPRVVVRMQCPVGTLSFAPSSPVTPENPDEDFIVLDGSLTAVNATLAGMQWSPPSATYRGVSTIAFNANDQGNTGAGGPLEASFTLTIAVTSQPVAVNDSYRTHGNVSLHIPGVGGATLLANDTDLDGPLTIVSNTAPGLGTVVIDTSDGSFVYTPPTGSPFAGTTFSYTVEDTDGNRAIATVSIAFDPAFWFVDSAAAAGGDGSYDHPFQGFDPLASVVFASTSSIYVRGRGALYPINAGSLQLPNGVSLYGSGAAVDLGPNGVLTLGPSPQLTGNVYCYGGNHVEGVTVVDPDTQNYGITVVGSGATFKNIVVDGFVWGIFANNGGNDLTVDDSFFTGQSQVAIHTVPNGAGNTLVRNVQITSAQAGIYALSINTAYHATFSNVTMRDIAGRGIAVDLGGNSSSLERRISVVSCDLGNAGSTANVVGSTAIDFGLAGGLAELRIVGNTLNGWSAAGIDLRGGNDISVNVNALVQNNTLIENAPGVFGAVGIQALAGVQGSLDYTLDGNTIGGDPLGIRLESNGAFACYDLTNNNAGLGSVANDIIGHGLPMMFDNFGSGVTITNYLAARGNLGTVAENGTTGSFGICRAPPVF